MKYGRHALAITVGSPAIFVAGRLSSEFRGGDVEWLFFLVAALVTIVLHLAVDQNGT